MSRRRYLAAYDIRHPKRLKSVHASMKAFGYALQYSVFVCDLDGMEKIAMRARVGSIIDHATDSIAIVDLRDPETRGIERFEFMGLLPNLPRGGAHIV